MGGKVSHDIIESTHKIYSLYMYTPIDGYVKRIVELECLNFWHFCFFFSSSFLVLVFLFLSLLLFLYFLCV